MRDKIVVPGVAGPIATEIRALVAPPLNIDMRVQQTGYVRLPSVNTSMVLRVMATTSLENVVPGQLHLGGSSVTELPGTPRGTLSLDREGVFVKASTHGSLEALVSFLRDNEIPVAACGIGAVSKSDLMKFAVKRNSWKHRELALILTFGVEVDES